MLFALSARISNLNSIYLFIYSIKYFKLYILIQERNNRNPIHYKNIGIPNRFLSN